MTNSLVKSAPPHSGRFIVMTQSRDTGRSNLLWIADLHEKGNETLGPNLKWHKVVNEWGSFYGDVANDGTKFYLMTDAQDSPNNKIVTYDLAHPDRGFQDLVAHDAKSPLTSVHVADQDKLVLLYSVDVKDVLYLHDLKTGARIKRLGEGLMGSVDQIAGERKHDEMWFSMSGFTSPGTVYRYKFGDDDATANKEEVYREAKVDGIKADDYISEQVFFESKDGTRVPMFVTRPKEYVCSSAFGVVPRLVLLWARVGVGRSGKGS